MPTLQQYQNLQTAILRKSLPAEAQVEFAAQTDLAVYEEQLIQRASTSTEAALLISQIVLGKVPASEQKLTDLTNFAQAQFNAYAAKGVAQPELGPYEALGRGFSGTPEFAAILAAAGSDGQFVTNIYVESFGTQPSAGQVQHFVDQINYFKGIYQAAGLSAADATLQAHGAVLGQIVGTAALVQGGPLDTAAEIWLRAEAAGTAKLDAPIGDSNPANGPQVPVDQTIPLTAGIDVIAPTADKPLDGNDTVLGNGQTIQSNDTIDLGAGFDKANLVIEPQSLLQLLTVYKLNLANVEQVNVTAGNLVNAAVPIQLSANGWTGVQEYWLRDSNIGGTGGVVLNDIKSNMTLGFDDYVGSATDLYKTGALGAGATVNVVLENISHVSLHTNTAVAGDDIGTMNLTVLGAGNTLALDLRSAGALDGLNKLFLFGDGGITLHNEAELNSLTVLDGSANSGGFDISLNSTANLVATGTSAADKLTFLSGFNANDSFNGGDGDDTLEVNVNSGAAATSANVSNVEHLQVFGALTSTQTFTNSAGFTSIELEDNGVTNFGHNLRLVNFANVIIDNDSNGLLQIANSGATHVTFGTDTGDAGGTLDVAEAGNVEISYNGTPGQIAHIGDLVLTRSNGFQTFQTTSLKFDGTGDISIDNAITGSINLVDLSADSGQFTMNGNVFGLGTDFLIGNLRNGSHIDLSAPSSNPASVNELVFSGKQMGSVQIDHFDATPGGAHDIIDVGALGISSLAELNITFSGGSTHIAANAGQFTGEIVVLGVNIVASAANYIDFNGHVG